MAEATEGIPSDATRHLIRTATGKGRKATRAVLVFTAAARRAIAAYDTDVNPLGLSDDDYLAVEDASGMIALLTVAADMEVVLTGVFDRAA